MNIKASKFNGYDIYYYDEKYFDLLKTILENKYEIVEMYAQLERGFVAKIVCDGRYYIIKKIYLLKKSKKLRSVFRKGEARETLENTTKIKYIEAKYEEKIEEFVEVYGAAVLRKNKMIQEEIMIIEYIDTKNRRLEKNMISLLMIEQFLKKLHLNGYCFGDVHPGNFLLDINNNLKAIDSKARKPFFGKYFFHKDMVNLKKGFAPEVQYIHPYKKDLSYKYLFFLKRIKNIKKQIKDNIKNFKGTGSR